MPLTAIEGMTEFHSVRVLAISSSEENRAALSAVLSSEGLVPILSSSMAEACALIENGDISIVFCDDCLSDGCLRNVVAEVGKLQRPIPVIAVSRTGGWHEYFDALRMGAFDYLSLPPRRDEWDRVLGLALHKRGTLTNRAKARVET